MEKTPEGGSEAGKGPERRGSGCITRSKRSPRHQGPTPGSAPSHPSRLTAPQVPPETAQFNTLPALPATLLPQRLPCQPPTRPVLPCAPRGQTPASLYSFIFFFWPRGLWDLSSLTRDRTCTPALEAWSLNHWTAREVPMCLYSEYHCRGHPRYAGPGQRLSPRLMTDSTHKLRQLSSSPSLPSGLDAHKVLGLLGPSSTGEVDDSIGWL